MDQYHNIIAWFLVPFVINNTIRMLIVTCQIINTVGSAGVEPRADKRHDSDENDN